MSAEPLNDSTGPAAAAERGLERLEELRLDLRIEGADLAALVAEAYDALDDLAAAFRLRRADYSRALLLCRVRGAGTHIAELDERVAERAAEIGRTPREPAKPRLAVAHDDPHLAEIPGSSVWYLRRASKEWVVVSDRMATVEFARAWPELPRTKEDDKPMTAHDLAERYGRRADRLVYTMHGASAFVPDSSGGGGELHIRVARVDPRLQPKRSPEVEEWLRLLAGASYDQLLDWLATLTQLHRPTAAIYLRGDPGVGKGLLAAGCSRVFGLSRTSYEDVVLSGYQSALKSCPIVHLDERAPKDPMGRGSAAFRSLVGESERPIAEKFRPTATLLGCPRLIITTNSHDALRLSEEDLTAEDQAAIATRILYIQADPAAASVLDRDSTADWVSDGDLPGKIPCHIAWLAQERIVVPARRLIVEGAGGEWIREVGWEGLPRAVLVAVVRSLSGEEDNGDERAVTPGAGFADVRIERLHARWQSLALDAKTPSLTALGRALGRVGTKVRLSDLARTRVYRIPADTIVRASDSYGLGDADTLRHRMPLPQDSSESSEESC